MKYTPKVFSWLLLICFLSYCSLDNNPLIVYLQADIVTLKGTEDCKYCNLVIKAINKNGDFLALGTDETKKDGSRTIRISNNPLKVYDKITLDISKELNSIQYTASYDILEKDFTDNQVSITVNLEQKEGIEGSKNSIKQNLNTEQIPSNTQSSSRE